MNKKNLIALIALMLFGVKNYAMEPLKTTAVVAPVVITIGVLSNIVEDRIKEGNFDFLTKEYIKTRVLHSPPALFTTSIPLLVAMYCGQKPEASIRDLLKPALYAFGGASIIGLSTAVVCYNLKDAGKGHDRNRMVINNSNAVFCTALFGFAPLFMAYSIYKNR